MEYQSSTTLGAESAWDSSDLHETSAPSAGSACPTGGAVLRAVPGSSWALPSAPAVLPPRSFPRWIPITKTTRPPPPLIRTPAPPRTPAPSLLTFPRPGAKCRVPLSSPPPVRPSSSFEELVPGFQEAYREQGTSADKNPNTSEMP